MEAPEPSPVEAALYRVGNLVAARASASRVIECVGEIVAGWAAEADMDAAAARLRIEQVWDSVSRDAADLQEQLSDAADAGSHGLEGGWQMLAALQAAAAALTAAHERL